MATSDARRPPNRIVHGPTGASWDGLRALAGSAPEPERKRRTVKRATPLELRSELWVLQDRRCVNCRRVISRWQKSSLITARTLLAVLRRQLPADAQPIARVALRAARLLDIPVDQIMGEPIAVVHTQDCFLAAVMLAHPTLTPNPVKERLIGRAKP